MKPLPLLVGLSVLCGLALANHAADQASSDDKRYETLAAKYIDGYFAWRPREAVAMGLHEYDGKVADVSAPSIRREHLRLMKLRFEIREIESTDLSRAADLERRALLASIDDLVLYFDVLKIFNRNPMTYSSAFDLTVYAKRNFAPLPDRMRSAMKILAVVPKSLADARTNLDARLPRVFVKTSIEEAKGSAEFFTGDLVVAFKDVKDDAAQNELKALATSAADEMRAFAKWLETERLPQSTDDFAIGSDAYARMLREGELISESPKEVLSIALRELKAEQERFTAAAKIIDPAKPAIEVYKAIQAEHPTAESLIPETVKHLEQIRQFVVDRKIISMPSDVRVKVDLTPTFARATSFASMDTPGPFETKATEAFYYVTPVEPEWDAKRKEEWLTAFNYYTTDVVSIHEAYPGHYQQHLHFNASPLSRTRKCFYSYAFVEGWAHYTEQMLLDEGFPGTGDRLRTAKYRLAQSDEALLRICRLCCSIKMHCDDMTVDEATKFFQDNCYYQEQPARQEAVRGTYDPGYLHYTLGKLMILKLRRDWQQQEGTAYSLQRFHDTMLHHGSPPLPLLRQIMLKDRKLWDAAL
ncbi:MAG: DUF885 domain-containing protein [Planctomycetaceae bacterium]|nr:DUF885 domain-containing protein [Planctomycetaceae bacterium]